MNKFTLYYPVKPIQISQPFGAIGLTQWYQQNGINIKGHNGIDFIASTGQPVYAAHDGVAFVETDVNQGHGVVLITNEQFDYTSTNCPEGEAYLKTIYWHLLPDIPIQNGQTIKAGDLLGYADSTGLATGSHLHFGLKPIRKIAGANQDATDLSGWQNIEQNNGYLGAIDPNPYFNGFYAQDAQETFSLFKSMILLLQKIVLILSKGR